MSDDLPTPERLGRIERGVQRRIDRRRQVAQRIAGASVAVVLVVGGIALVRPTLGFSGGASGSSAGGTAQQRTAAVVCHDATGTRTVRVATDRLPAAAITACSAAVAAGASSARPDAVEGTSASKAPSTPTPLPTSVLCETAKGVLHVYLANPAPCSAHGQDPAAP